MEEMGGSFDLTLNENRSVDPNIGVNYDDET
jgi:hypothetical protein